MTVIVRSDRGKVLARLNSVGKYHYISGTKRWSANEMAKVAHEMWLYAAQRNDSPPAEVADMLEAEPACPPLHGPGSGRDVWADYARRRRIEVTDAMTRGDIIDACRVVA